MGGETSASMGTKLNSALMTNIEPSTIITEFVAILPWIGAMVGAAFVIYEARKMLRGAAQGKVRV